MAAAKEMANRLGVELPAGFEAQLAAAPEGATGDPMADLMGRFGPAMMKKLGEYADSDNEFKQWTMETLGAIAAGMNHLHDHLHGRHRDK